MADEDQRIRDAQREYLDFLDDEELQAIYSSRVKEMITEGTKRLIVKMDHLQERNPERAKTLLSTSFDEQLAFQRALKEYVATLQPSYAKQHEDFFVGFEGAFGHRHVTPRSLTSR